MRQAVAQRNVHDLEKAWNQTKGLLRREISTMSVDPIGYSLSYADRGFRLRRAHADHRGG